MERIRRKEDKEEFFSQGFLLSPYRACGVVGQSPTKVRRKPSFFSKGFFRRKKSFRR